jgi:hypothetical protein
VKRLIKKGLMFGNLVAVDSPALVERYNRALKHLTGRETKLTDFYIDISGYSLEIGEELKDPLYLNPNGCNRQFILLSIAQKTAPLLNAKFSSARQILRDYIDLNEAELFALTARDAVAGELVNSIYDLSDPARLFDIRRIKVEADTTGNTVAEAKILAEKIDRFKNEEDAWFDDVLIAQMIELASETGDVLKNPIALTPLSVDEQNFWTSHFGGLYIFRDVEHPAAISVEPSEALGSLPIAKVFDLTDRNAVARFLELNELVEPIVRARGIDAAAVLGQKMDFILVDVAAELGHDVGHASRRDLRMLAQKIGANVGRNLAALGLRFRQRTQRISIRYARALGPFKRSSINCFQSFRRLIFANSLFAIRSCFIRHIAVGLRLSGAMSLTIWSASIRSIRPARARRCLAARQWKSRTRKCQKRLPKNPAKNRQSRGAKRSQISLILSAHGGLF